MKFTHRDIQLILAELGKILGYETKIECPVIDKKIDVVWVKDKDVITFEIENTNAFLKDKVIENCFKSLYIATKHIHICPETKYIKKEDLKKISQKVYPIFLKKRIKRTTYEVKNIKPKYEKFKHILFDESIRKMKDRIKLFCLNTGCSRATAFNLLKFWRKQIST